MLKNGQATPREWKVPGTALGVIGICFGVEIVMANPDWGRVIRGFALTVEIAKNSEMFYLRSAFLALG